MGALFIHKDVVLAVPLASGLLVVDFDAVAVGVSEIEPQRDAVVDGVDCSVGPYPYQTMALSKRARQFVAAFDSGKTVKPSTFRFTLT